MNKVLLVGCGHMGSALLNEWMNLKSHSITVKERDFKFIHAFNKAEPM